MTNDHKASIKSEQDRIFKAGGYIKNDRVNGSLAITRAFGDFFYKKAGVTSEPEIKEYEVQAEDWFLLIASDGLWDVVDDAFATEFLCKAEDLEIGCAELVQIAIEKGSADNVSCMVIEL